MLVDICKRGGKIGFACRVEVIERNAFHLRMILSENRFPLFGIIRYCTGAPAAIQAASTCRSLAEISVTFPGGMARERTALISISLACSLICSGLSSSTPLGAE